MDPDTVGDIFPQDSDYDGAWKEALRLHLTDFLASFFPAVHAAIDWSGPLEWCDKELSQILGQAGSRNKRVDLLAKVFLRSGQPQWILLHLEIQSASEPEFAPDRPLQRRLVLDLRPAGRHGGGAGRLDRQLASPRRSI